jgi:hypothetical protein
MRKTLTTFTLATLLSTGCLPLDPADGETGTIEEPVTRAPLSTQPLWSVLISGYGTWCSASIISDRWLVTAAHCLEGKPAEPANLRVRYSTTLGVNTQIYNGPAKLFVNPGYDGPSNAVKDVGLVYLKGWGLPIEATGRMKMFDDSRKPWVSGSSEPNGMALAGWGVGSDPGGTTDCEDPDPGDTTSMRKRLGTGLTVDRTSNTRYATAPIGGTHACGGDSGGSYLLWRGSGSDADYFQFAVHSGRRGSPTRHQGPLLDDNFAWIDATLDAETQSIYGNYWSTGVHGGYRYKVNNMMTRGWHPMVSLASKCMHTTGGAGSPVQLRTCNLSGNQSWAFYPDGSLRSAVSPGTWLCLEAPNTTNGTDTRLAACNGSNQQKFWYTPSRELRSALNVNKCIEVQGGFTTDGTPIQVYDCNGTASQLWQD